MKLRVAPDVDLVDGNEKNEKKEDFRSSSRHKSKFVSQAVLLA